MTSVAVREPFESCVINISGEVLVIEMSPGVRNFEAIVFRSSADSVYSMSFVGTVHKPTSAMLASRWS